MILTKLNLFKNDACYTYDDMGNLSPSPEKTKWRDASLKLWFQGSAVKSKFTYWFKTNLSLKTAFLTKSQPMPSASMWNHFINLWTEFRVLVCPSTEALQTLDSHWGRALPTEVSACFFPRWSRQRRSLETLSEFTCTHILWATQLPWKSQWLFYFFAF